MENNGLRKFGSSDLYFYFDGVGNSFQFKSNSIMHARTNIGELFGWGINDNGQMEFLANGEDTYGTSATRMVIDDEDSGFVGIGNLSPESKLHIGTGGMTIDHDNSSTDVINFKLNNPVSSAGIVFNSAAGLINGGLLHAQTRTQLFRGNNSNLGLTVGDNNYLGLNNNTPDVPLHVNYNVSSSSSTTGTFILGSVAGAHLTFDVDEINAYSGTSGRTLYLNQESDGDVSVGFGSGPLVSDLVVTGFTKLGNSAPNIKMLELTGTTGATEGSFVNIPHGLDPSNILAIDISVNYGGTSYVPENYTASLNYEYNYYFNSTNIVVLNKPDNSAFIIGDPIRILVTYKE
jgi:hypothetical protein